MVSIFIGNDDDSESIRDFVANNGGDWVHALDTQDLASSYGIGGVPTEVVVDVNGYVRLSHPGSMSESQLAFEIEEAVTGYEPPESNVLFFVAVVTVSVLTVVLPLTFVMLRLSRGQEKAP